MPEKKIESSLFTGRKISVVKQTYKYYFLLENSQEMTVGAMISFHTIFESMDDGMNIGFYRFC